MDGLWFTFHGMHWVLYLRALKPISQAQAFFLDPVLLPGRELPGRWTLAIEHIPPELKKRVKALVCDGFRSSHRLAAKHGWTLQRCHFHLLLQLQANRGGWKLKRRADRKLRESMYQDVRAALATPNPKKLRQIVRRLRHALGQPQCPRRYGAIVREFLRRLEDFRAYLRQPELNPPITTNTMESMNKLIRAKTHMLPTPAALRQWTLAMVRTIKKLKCNGHITNQIK
ncbi:MAG: hypothetical protein HYW56_01380 [Candidatus Harrisonbacteria bacterium]|nr:hypothetical protein [Candidatus Harrisonbacteria bacterium]